MSDINSQSEYWDSVAWEKTFVLPLDMPRFRELVPLHGRILDYGCGYGRLSARLWDEGYHNVVGVDIAPQMIERAKREYPGPEFVAIEGGELPYAGGSFDAALLVAVLTCIPTDEGQRRVVGGLHRVLRPGGIICVADYLIQEDQRNVQRYRESEKEFGTYGIFRHPEGAVMRHHSGEWISSLLSGFETIEMVELDVRTMNGNPARAFRYLGRKP